jgi:hypothetical protein
MALDCVALRLHRVFWSCCDHFYRRIRLSHSHFYVIGLEGLDCQSFDAELTILQLVSDALLSLHEIKGQT